MTRKVIGFESGINKKYNTPFTVLHTVTQFDDFSVQNRKAIGQKAESTYIRAEIPCVIGDIVDFIYQPGYNNEATVSGVNIVQGQK